MELLDQRFAILETLTIDGIDVVQQLGVPSDECPVAIANISRSRDVTSVRVETTEVVVVLPSGALLVADEEADLLSRDITAPAMTMDATTITNANAPA
jgi:hypothetical protein